MFYAIAGLNAITALNAQIEMNKARYEMLRNERARNFAVSRMNEAPTNRPPCRYCGRTIQKFKHTTCEGCGGGL